MMRNYNMPRQPESQCGCGQDSSYDMISNRTMPGNFVVAMAYVPWQDFTEMYEPDRALQAGTIFPELDLPFWAGKAGVRR